MRREVLSASNFLVDLVRLNSSALSEEQLIKFRDKVCECLWSFYKDHWFPEQPFKGSGYRCIRINGKMDPLIAKAGDLMGLASTFVHSLFPSELTMWVDPSEVSYRIGENGSICVIYDESKTAGELTGSQQQQERQVTPQKQAPKSLTATPQQQPPPSPSHPMSRQPAGHQFSPSKSIWSPSHQQQSPPLSPMTAQYLQQQQQQANLALFTRMAAKDAVWVNCKESLRGGMESIHGVPLERLFVSS